MHMLHTSQRQISANTSPATRRCRLETLEQRRLLSGEALSDSMLSDKIQEDAQLDGPGAAPQVLAPHSTVAGATLGEWSARWWQWLASIPAAVNPALDQTGADAAQGQSGQVFYLAGSAGTDPVVRNIQLPAGKFTFFPMVTFSYLAGIDGPALPIQEERDIADSVMDLVTSLHANLDGRAIGGDLFAHREIDPFADGFDITIPEGNIFGADPGTYGPCVTDGYWLMLSPLPRGQHTLTFDAVVDFGGGSTFTQDITYHIQVVPGGMAQTDMSANWIGVSDSEDSGDDALMTIEELV